MKEGLVSVIIPCYNGEKFIDRSIGSVYKQNYSNIELIVVDDGSTDNSKEKIIFWKEKFKEKGFDLRYIYQNNRGLGGAIDTGLKYINGEYLTLLDCDDSYLNNSISLRAEFLKNKKEYVGVRTNGWFVKGNERKLFINSDEEKKIEDLFTALSSGKTNNWAGTYLIRTKDLFEFYKEKNIFPSRFGQNFQLLLPVSYKRKVGYIDLPLMEYYIQENSLSRNCDLEKSYRNWEMNASGWREIYINVLKELITDEEEYNYYLNLYNSTYYRSGFYRGITYDKKEAVKEYYHLLCLTKLNTLNDKIDYYHYFNSLIVIPLKIYRRIKMLFY